MSGENYAIHIPMHISDRIIKRLINGFPNLPFKMFGAYVCVCVFKCFVTPPASRPSHRDRRERLFASSDTCYFQFSVCCFAPLIAECKITRTVWLIVFVYCDNCDYTIFRIVWWPRTINTFVINLLATRSWFMELLSWFSFLLPWNDTLQINITFI